MLPVTDNNPAMEPSIHEALGRAHAALVQALENRNRLRTELAEAETEAVLATERWERTLQKAQERLRAAEQGQALALVPRDTDTANRERQRLIDAQRARVVSAT